MLVFLLDWLCSAEKVAVQLCEIRESDWSMFFSQD